MRRRLYLAVAALALWIAPTPAQASGLTLAEQTWPSPCAGRTTATVDPALHAHGNSGQATGLRATWTGTAWAWRTETCEYTVAPGLDSLERCRVDVHEYLHLALEQAAHVGPLAPRALDRTLTQMCPAPQVSPRTQVISHVRKLLPPRPRWRITCTRVRPRMRCRARAHRQPDRRYSVQLTRSTITVRPATDPSPRA